MKRTINLLLLDICTKLRSIGLSFRRAKFEKTCQNIKHLLDEIECNIRFVLPGQVILGEANLSLTSLDPAKLI